MCRSTYGVHNWSQTVVCASFLVDIKAHTCTSTLPESHVLSALNHYYPSKYTSLSGMLLLSLVSQIVSRYAFLYAQLYLLFVYNSSIFFRNDCGVFGCRLNRALIPPRLPLMRLILFDLAFRYILNTANDNC